jgi:sodium transport system ATP-binding protein
MIEVVGLSKRYGKLAALSSLSLTVVNGRITGLLGPNGAGKTTTLRIISSLVRPDSGSVTVDGADVHLSPAQARARLGVLPDDRGLYPRLTAREHIAYFGGLHGLPRDVLERRVTELAELLDMAPLLDRRVDGFSQGERTKVAIARALVHSPPNVILDEATNGLDVVSTRAMRDVIRHLAATGSAVLFSSHIMSEVSALCDHIVVLNRGRVVATGSKEELMELTHETNLEAAFVRLINVPQPS